MQNFYRPTDEVGQLGMQSDVLSHLHNVREQEKPTQSFLIIIRPRRKRKLTCNKKKTSLISIYYSNKNKNEK